MAIHRQKRAINTARRLDRTVGSEAICNVNADQHQLSINDRVMTYQWRCGGDQWCHHPLVPTRRRNLRALHAALLMSSILV
eukprot:scaffold2347_cov208-Alexandrium_tamarense.AAC.2